MLRTVRDLLALAVGLLPASPWKNRLLTAAVPGWTVAPSAVVGPCLLFRIEKLTVADHATIGLGAVVKNLRSVTLGVDALLGRFNTVSAAPGLVSTVPEMTATLEVGDGAVIVARHSIDCSGGVRLKEKCGIAGHGTTVLTHQVDIIDIVQRAAPVVIGRSVIVGTDSIVLMGVEIADYVICGAGAVIPKSIPKSYAVFAGNPARFIRDLPQDLAFWTRDYPHIPNHDPSVEPG